VAPDGGARIRREHAPLHEASIACAISWLGLIVGLAVAPAPADAETLGEAWAAAAGYDLTLKAAQDRLESAEEALLSARGERMPAVSATSTAMRWNEVPAFVFGGLGVPGELRLFDSRTMTLSTANISVPIYTGGRVSSGIDAADAAVAARRSEASSLTQQNKLDVAAAYIDVLRAEHALEVMASNVAALEAHARIVNDMYTVGQVPRNDYLAATVSLADARQRELTASGQLDMARSAYNRALGRPLTQTVVLDANLPSVSSAIDGVTPEELLDLAIANRHELAAASSAVDVLAAQSVAARAATRPQLFLTGAYTMLDNEFLNDDRFWTVGVGVQWRFFDSGRTRHAAQALSREAAAMSRERSELETQIALQIRETWLRLRTARERIRVAEQAIEQADENLRVASDRYRNGEGANTEVLDAEALRSLSRSNYDNAVYEAAYAEFALARAVGIL